MKLYELAAEYRAMAERLQELDLPPEVVLDTIEGEQGDLREKLKAVVIVATEMQEEAKVRATHAKRMADSAKSLENRAEGLLSYAMVAIQTTGVAMPLKYPEFTLGMQKNPPSCEIVDAEKLPALYKAYSANITFTSAHAADLKDSAIAEALKAFGVTGVAIEAKPDKREVLAALKTVAEANASKPEGEAKDGIPGARLNPTSFRLTVK